MLALSIVSPNGARMASGRKALEIRSWRPPQWPLRDLLIIENNLFLTGEDEVDPAGVAVAVVDIEQVLPWQPWQLEAAYASEWVPDHWAWQVTRVRPISGTLPLRAQRRLYDVAVSKTLLAVVG